MMTMKRREVLSLIGAAAALPGCATSSASEEVNAALRRIVEDATQPLSGLSVLVQGADGRVLHEAQFGRRYIAPGADLPINRDTLFRVASVSKIVTALAVMRLVEAGKLDLEADVSQYLGYPLRNPNFPAHAISVRLLLSHQSSLTDAGGLYLSAGQTMQGALAPGGSHARGWAQRTPPGTYFQYCNLAYGVLASVIERASGQRFDQFAAREVLAPLGMEGGFDGAQLTDYQRANTAVLYRKQGANDVWDLNGPWVAQADDFRAQPPQPMPGLDSYVLGSNGSLFGPQGRLRTRVQDLGRMMTMLQKGGIAADGKRFLKPESVAALCTERWRYDASAKNGDNLGGWFLAWGLGLQHYSDRSEGPGFGDRLRARGGIEAWGHQGFSYGLQAGFQFSPQAGVGIVYVVGGHAADPWKNKGRFSAAPAWEERINDLLWSQFA